MTWAARMSLEERERAVKIALAYGEIQSLKALLNRVLDWYGDGEDLGDDWQATDRLMADISKAVGREWEP
jgi:hypothetical protein